MAKFKVGDKVRRLPQFIEVLGWDSGAEPQTVTDVIQQRPDVEEEIAVSGRIGYWIADRFELVEAAPAPVHVSSRSNDPSTSKAAGKVKRVSLREQLAIDFAVCGEHGLTGHEAALRLGGYHKLNSITPRFAELRREGKIKDSGQRRDKQIVWVLVWATTATAGITHRPSGSSCLMAGNPSLLKPAPTALTQPAQTLSAGCVLALTQ